MLVQSPKHKKWHSLAPKAVSWGVKKEPVMTSIDVTRSSMEGEQISFRCPVFKSDTREELSDRLGLLFSVVQDRLEDANEAWKEAAEKAKEDDEEG